MDARVTKSLGCIGNAVDVFVFAWGIGQVFKGVILCVTISLERIISGFLPSGPDIVLRVQELFKRLQACSTVCAVTNNVRSTTFERKDHKNTCDMIVKTV